MDQQNVFRFTDIQHYLQELAESRGKRGGMKQELAEAMGTHPGYLSRVLTGQAQLSLEQAEKLATHLQFTDEEKRFLLFLLQEERAATPQLKKFFREERSRIQERRLNIKDRIPDSKQITKEEQSIYYSAWFYQAIHVLISIPKFREVDVIAENLELPPSTVREAIIFLERTGIIKRTENRWVAGETHLHLERNSPHIRQHHANWRMRSIHSLDRMSNKDLRYSAIFSLSEKDAEKLKEEMLRHLNVYLETVKSSKEEKAYVYCFDFFEA